MLVFFCGVVADVLFGLAAVALMLLLVVLVFLLVFFWWWCRVLLFGHVGYKGTVVSIQVRISRYTLPSPSPMQTGSLLGQLSRCCRRFAFSFEKSEQVDFGRFPQIVLVYDMRADVTCVRCYLFPLFIIPQPLKLHSAPDTILVLTRI